MIGTSSLQAEQPGPKLGETISSEEIAVWDNSVFPNGKGLPPGNGDSVDGEKVYQQHCVNCHGHSGIGTDIGEQLAGAQMGLKSEYPEKTIGSYWPYATTLFDFIRRSMPMTAPGSLKDNEVYAVTAYLLYLNNIITKTHSMNARTLTNVKMPNEAGFINIYQKEKMNIKQ